MSKENFDITNTTRWQQIDGSVFLLEETKGYYNTRTANSFCVTVNQYHPFTSKVTEEEIASKICEFLNRESIALPKKVS